MKVLEAIKFAARGIPLEVQIEEKPRSLQERLATFTRWKAMRSKKERLYVRAKNLKFSCRVLHMPVFSIFRPVYYGEIKESENGSLIRGKFRLATLTEAICWLVFGGVLAWLAVSIVRLMRFGVLSERTVDLVGFLLFLLGPILFFALFLMVLVGGIRIYQVDLKTMGLWLENLVKENAEIEESARSQGS